METIDYNAPGPVSEAYLEDRSPVSLIEGPVGSGKTVASLMKGFMISAEQKPWKGTRYSRGLVMRNTYPELISTVIKSFSEWFPTSIAPINFSPPISARLKFWLPDKTSIDCEIYFISYDRPEDVKKLKSLEVTWAILSEASELGRSALDMATQRVGRYPPARWGGPTWYGVFGDTNMPDDDHYIYKIFENEKPEGFKVFKQPGGLIYKGGDPSSRDSYEPNPAAENIAHLPGGHEYYFRQLAGKSKDWIKVFILAQYGSVISGKPVYPEYNDDIHCKPVKPYPKIPLILGFDFGLTPACSICQLSPRGQFIVLDELVAQDMGIRQFGRDVVIPHLSMNYSGFTYQGVGDPSGMSRKDTDEKTCFMELAELGIPCVPASSNNFTARREAVAKYLTKMTDGQPGFLIDPKADLNRRGHRGRYQFNRIQVSGERFRDVPDKNDASHPCEATQYAALYSLTMNNNEFWSKKIEYPKMGIV